ncbi:DUF2335 domain-containing protein [Paraburkholderia fungorum]|uniref:DUF2335 domain-containing protein n=1 Tax=Paraburkholderia fungorum TaxID=134537 RepID=UPI0038B74C35
MDSDQADEMSSGERGVEEQGSPNYAPAKSKIDGKFHVVDEQQIEKVVERAILRAEAFSGPTPHPKHLERYEVTFPGASKIIFEQYQANSQHNREMEKGMLDLQRLQLDQSFERDKSSLSRAFWLVLGGFVVIAACAYFKQTALGIAVSGTLLVAVLRSYLPKGWLGKESGTLDQTTRKKTPADKGESSPEKDTNDEPKDADTDNAAGQN